MILGDVCTRNCGFCAVRSGRPEELDRTEPVRVAEAVAKLGIKYAVITSVTRDELEDGGAEIFSATIEAIRLAAPQCRVEVLIPDFGGSPEALEKVITAAPDVLGHNLETVPRLYSAVRPQANYARSLELLARAKNEGMVTKSGLMLGLGENVTELLSVMSDLREAQCDLLTLGQYLQPSKSHLPVIKYYHPDEFAFLKDEVERMGFMDVVAGPLVRSSYYADRQADLAPDLYSNEQT